MLAGLNISTQPAYISSMASERVPSPQDTIKIRQLPAKGATVRLEAEVMRVAEPEGGHQGLVTLRIPGFSTPITIPASYLPEDG
jgi:hypothetical protein